MFIRIHIYIYRHTMDKTWSKELRGNLKERMNDWMDDVNDLCLMMMISIRKPKKNQQLAAALPALLGRSTCVIPLESQYTEPFFQLAPTLSIRKHSRIPTAARALWWLVRAFWERLLPIIWHCFRNSNHKERNAKSPSFRNNRMFSTPHPRLVPPGRGSTPTKSNHSRTNTWIR